MNEATDENREPKKGDPRVLADLMMLIAAALAGTGGALGGVRFADAINRRLGRDAPPLRRAAKSEID